VTVIGAAASALGPAWAERLNYVQTLAKAGKWREIAVLGLGGPPRIAARAFSRALRAARIRAHPDARPLDSAIEWLTPDGRIALVPASPNHAAGPLVSVVIPCFNYGRFVREALESVRAQTIAPVETIIVDDGSTDPETIAVLDGLDWRPHEQLLRQANAGLPSARNAGIALATGRYICCLDADDRLDPRYLEMAISALELNPSAGFAYSNVRLFGDESHLWRTKPFDLIEARRNNQVAVSAVFRRNDWALVGGYSPSMQGGYEDWAFWLALAAIGRRGVCLREPLFFHRKHGRTMTVEAHERRCELMQRLRAGRPELFANENALARRVAFGLATAPSLAKAMTPQVREWISKPRPGRVPLTVVAPYLVRGGADAILRDVSAHAADGGFDVEVLTTLPHTEHELQPEFATFAAKIVHLPDLVAPERCLEHLVERVNARGGGVILSCGSSFLYQNAAALRQAAPSIRWIDIVHTDRKEGHLAAALSASAAIDVHVAGAMATFRALAAAGVPDHRRVFIQNGVDAAVFDPRRWDKAKARALFGLPEDAFVVGFVGRMATEKRPVIAARLAAHAARVEQTWFLAVGDGPLAQTAMAKAPRRTVWRPRLADANEMAMAYRAMDVLALPSEVEAAPLSLLEAMAMGLPALATDVGDVPFLIVDGETGWLAPVDDPMALAPKLLELAHHPAKAAEMGARAIAHFARSGWTKHEMINLYAGILRRQSDAVTIGP
jgi:glycosyltransferase involved in cell wall biosynthesis